MPEIGAFLSSEEHGPRALVRQAQMAEDAKTLIEAAVRNFLAEVPALAPMKLVVGVDLRGRGDTQQFRVQAKHVVVGHAGDVIAYDAVPGALFRLIGVSFGHRFGMLHVKIKKLFESVYGTLAIDDDGRLATFLDLIEHRANGSGLARARVADNKKMLELY